MKLHAKAAKFYGKKILLHVKFWRRKEMCGAFLSLIPQSTKGIGIGWKASALLKCKKALNLSVDVQKNSMQY